VTATLDAQLLFKAILTAPEEDVPRLEYADCIREQGEDDRAEFIAVQCELARIVAAGTADPKRYVDPGSGKYETPPDFARWKELDSREQKLLNSDSWISWNDLQQFSRMMEFADHGSTFGLYPHPVAHEANLPIRVDWKWSRGFISEITLSAADWLTHADALVWHPEQTMECIDGALVLRTGKQSHIGCACGGTGRVPRPCPPTAQPITRVTLTTMPEIPTYETSSSIPYSFTAVVAGQTVRIEEEDVVAMREPVRQPGPWADLARTLIKTVWSKRWRGVDFTLPPE
jgi:uncharacterized protein (TIGR02996 family)